MAAGSVVRRMGGRRPAGVGTLALARGPKPSVDRARQGRPRGGDRHHWGAARVDRLDDLGVVDALESDGVRASPGCWAIPDRRLYAVAGEA